MTLDGAPYVETVLLATSDGQETELEGAMKGGIRIRTESNPASALCVINLNIRGVERADGSGTQSLEGVVCGQTFDEEVVTPPDGG